MHHQNARPPACKRKLPQHTPQHNITHSTTQHQNQLQWASAKQILLELGCTPAAAKQNRLLQTLQVPRKRFSPSGKSPAHPEAGSALMFDLALGRKQISPSPAGYFPGQEGKAGAGGLISQLSMAFRGIEKHPGENRRKGKKACNAKKKSKKTQGKMKSRLHATCIQTSFQLPPCPMFC